MNKNEKTEKTKLTMVSLRMEPQIILDLKNIASSKGTKYQTLVRNILKEFVSKNK